MSDDSKKQAVNEEKNKVEEQAVKEEKNKVEEQAVNEEKNKVEEQAVKEEKNKVEEDEKDKENGEVGIEGQINDDIFITEDNRFEIEIKYFIDPSLKDPIISGYDDLYTQRKNELNIEEKSFTLSFKHPSQRDTEAIMSRKSIGPIDDLSLSDFIDLENIRLGVLLRSWTIDKNISEISNIHPKIVKAIRYKVTLEIGANGFI